MSHNSNRVLPKITLPETEDEQMRYALTQVLEEHAKQINLGASINTGSVTLAATFVLVQDFTLVDATAGTVTAFLMPAAEWRDRVVRIKKVSTTNTITVHAQAGETIDETACITVSGVFSVLTVLSNGNAWYTV
jgi:energy-converting hydrogenase Eha subunit F